MKLSTFLSPPLFSHLDFGDWTLREQCLEQCFSKKINLKYPKFVFMLNALTPDNNWRLSVSKITVYEHRDAFIQKAA